MRIIIIGSGNVATQLGIAFQKAGHVIAQVISRNEKTGITLSKKLKCDFEINFASEKKVSNDLFLIAVKDSQIVEVVKDLEQSDKIVLHTSGSIDVNVFRNKFKNYGVLYPLQTIKFNRAVNFKKVPVCIEASNVKSEKIVFALAKSITENIFALNSEQRLRVHLAAVIANNFTNHLYTLSEKFLMQNNLPFELLKPLIEQTAKNVLHNSPAQLQTGPAMRNDKVTIEKHLKLFEHDKELQRIYKVMTDSIVRNMKD